ncbi:MAG: TIGR03013 family PEP-CTERM/XrtA system glycosyltransferase [Sutterellaceae bacterium]|nr:TIGR03013 family PEP-CTERM/XrtA system glycosyltransferase [Burkholderiaceae bacterium]MDW8429576.1 TIGR03013 family PEP-CTERM/XrtA system glycosyltransferase [Sutterellaceae bacterium]
MVKVFRHHVPVGTVVQIAADAALFFGAVLLAVYVQLAPYGTSVSTTWLPALGFAAVMTALTTVFGLYRRDMQTTLPRTALRVLLALLAGLPIVYMVLVILPNGAVVQHVLGYALLYAFAGVVLARQSADALAASGLGAKRVLIVGTGPEAVTVERSLRTLRYPRIDVVGFYQAGEAASHAVERERVIPRSLSLTDVVERLQVKEVIVAVREQRGGVLPLRELLDCRVRGIPVTDLSAFYEKVRGEVPIESLKASWLIYGSGFEQGNVRTFIKRAFDLVVALALLVLAAPLMLLTALAIKLDSPGPVIYRQVRTGRAGRPFTVLKFRSMRTDAEHNGVPVWAQANDARVTRVGRVIRKLRIDELPQLINVLRGEMSFVGPRPERPEFVAKLKEQIPFYDLRHSVKPGLTGWAQVRFAYAASVDDARTKLQYDLYYVKNHSLFLDILILFETVRVVLFREGAH